jgi:hypothetical protein
MALIGSIGAFDVSTDQWSSYKERLEQFFAANDIADEKHVAVLLSVIGGKTYELLRTLTAPDLPANKSFGHLCEVLERHIAPKTLVIAERFRFHRRNQRPGEAISDYCVAIQKLSEHCQFGTTLNDALRDRLVCGLVSEQTQRKLLVEADLTYDRAKAIALAAETATKDAGELRKPPAGEVNKLKAKASSSTTDAKKMLCTRCGKTNHEQATCYFREKFCNKCSKKGIQLKCVRRKLSNKINLLHIGEIVQK